MRIIKRILDFIIALKLLVLFSPLLVIVAIIILIDSGRPILFRQQRPGYKEKPFMLNKFRTMKNTFDSTGKLLPDGQRLTAVGKALRKLSLDELPQLFNVLIGHMSLVGPRPLLMQYLPLYNAEQKRRHDVRPGITGWAQVNGRNTVQWDQRFKLDVWYVDHWSLALDFKIILMTLLKVIKREGISAAGSATMPEFTGSDKK